MRVFARIALACSTVLLLAAPGRAQEDEWAAPPPAWEGVWAGSVGRFPVHLCLDKTPHQQKGAYYYDRVGRLLRLVPGEASGEWFEQKSYGENGARWTLSARDGALAGTWSDGKTSWPVKLARIGGPSADYDGPCGTRAFHRPRMAPVRLTSARAVKDGARYTRWTFKPGPGIETVEISTFTLERPGPRASRIDSLLRAALPEADGTGEWLDCVAAGANASGLDGSFYKIIEPTLITERWLAANEHGEYYCGGAHPTNVNTPRTFDMARGVEVDPLDWLDAQAVHREDLGGEYGVYTTLKPDFVAAILGGWQDRERPECDEAMRSQRSWTAGIARGSLVFEPDFPRVIMACGESFPMPFARLQPWLNAEGKAAVATLPR